MTEPDELHTYLNEQLADPEFARAYAAGRVPGRRWWVSVLVLLLLMAGMLGLAFVLHGLAVAFPGW